MALFKEHQVSSRFTGLICGDSGAGKTSLIATLANAGYKVRIFDSDNGLDILASLLTKKGKANTHYISTVRGKEGWARFLKVTNRVKLNDAGENEEKNGWIDGDEDLGDIRSWESDTVFVVDTLDMLAGACLMPYVLDVNKQVASRAPRIQDYGEAGRRLRFRIDSLTGAEFACNIIFNTHIRTIEAGDYGGAKLYPATIGSSLSMDIGDYFNNVLRIDTVDKGGRMLRTTSDTKMDLKTSAGDLFKAHEPFDLALFIDKIKQNAKEAK